MTRIRPQGLSPESARATYVASVDGENFTWAGEPVTLGGGAPTALGDFARWSRSGAPDATSGSVDYDTDLVDSRGTTIAADDSANWVSGDVAWGYPVAMVTEAGVYAISFAVTDDSISSVAVAVMDDGGSSVTDYPTFLTAITTEGPGGPFFGAANQIVYLAAGAHLELTVSGGASITQLDLMIQRVG